MYAPAFVKISITDLPDVLVMLEAAVRAELAELLRAFAEGEPPEVRARLREVASMLEVAQSHTTNREPER